MDNKELTIAKDFLAVENNNGDLMFIILYHNGTKEPNSDAHILYGSKGPHAVLIKNDDHAIILDYLEKETLNLMKKTSKAIITEIEYNEELFKYNLTKDFSKDDLCELLEAAEAHHALRACYEVALKKITNFDDRFQHYIEAELERIK